MYYGFRQLRRQRWELSYFLLLTYHFVWLMCVCIASYVLLILSYFGFNISYVVQKNRKETCNSKVSRIIFLLPIFFRCSDVQMLYPPLQAFSFHPNSFIKSSFSLFICSLPSFPFLLAVSPSHPSFSLSPFLTLPSCCLPSLPFLLAVSLPHPSSSLSPFLTLPSRCLPSSPFLLAVSLPHPSFSLSPFPTLPSRCLPSSPFLLVVSLPHPSSSLSPFLSYHPSFLTFPTTPPTLAYSFPPFLSPSLTSLFQPLSHLSLPAYLYLPNPFPILTPISVVYIPHTLGQFPLPPHLGWGQHRPYLFSNLYKFVRGKRLNRKSVRHA